MKRLERKISIVTGGSSGIGKAIALTFAAEGSSVVIAARRHGLCDQVVAQIREGGGEAVAIPTDISDELEVERLISETRQHFGQLDILVNNAGIGGGGRIVEASTEVFDRVMNTNLRGTFFCCRAGFRQMMQNGGGTIINISSVCGVDAWAGTGIYSMSKYGIMALTKTLADEGRQYNIKACAICPGGVRSALVDAPPDEIERSDSISPFDIAEAAVYIATLGPNAVVHQIVVDRLGADW
ncbi:MAG: SDR family NAD(P)-dependent oxidoreductase [Candidatus Poribacteria bacterium]|nr:SDR family NAD(P)-dependent oxidoreductase [Candidatus Poribacteria bacterium]